MTKIASLLSQKQQIESEIERLSAENKAQAIEDVRALIKAHHISIRELGIRENPLKGRKVPPKFFGPNGETWAGRGKKPLWFKDAKQAS